jgi:protoporphyrin/coproporphyrin ferrochelatase
VIFTAHSLPERVIASGDRYADEVGETAQGVANRAGITRYERAYQSAGRTPEPWIGPSLDQLIDDQSATTRKFLVVPIGFVCDHTEILFDIDVQAARVAREFSTTLRRTESLNTSPTFIAMLEDIVRARLSSPRL